MTGKWRLMTAASLTALCAHPAWAQTAPADTAGATPTVAEVVVTAQKRSENVQTVPIAISVVSSDDLQRQHIFDASQLQYIVPSLQQQSTNNQVGATNFSIRGVGTAIYGPAVESTVATVIDDVALSRPSMGVVQFFDLDHIEVLRGPQGMLFGKNASAGLINIVTAMPRLGVQEGLAHLSYGNMDSGSSGNEFVAQGALNIPLTANSAARISAFATRQDGYGRNVTTGDDLGSQEYGGRLKYLWRPSDDLEVYLEGDYAHEKGPGGSVLFRRFDAPGGFVAAMDALSGIVAGPDNVEIGSNARTDNHFDVGGVQAREVYRFADGYALTNITAFRFYRDKSFLDTDTLPISFFDLNDQGRRQQQFSEELRLTSPSGRRFEYQVGLYYLDLRDSGFNTLGANLEPVFPPPPPGFLANIGSAGSSTLRNKSYAAFGQGRFSVTDNLRLIAGGRFTHDDIVGSGNTDVSDFLIPLSPPGGSTAGLKKDNFSYRVGLEADLGPQVMAYVTYARGYKAPTFGGPTGVAPIKAEIPTDIEVGLKSTLFDRRLVLNLALYSERFKDYQAQAFDPSVLHFTTMNAGSVVARGVEADFTALPFEGLTINGAFAYNDAYYQSFSGVACYYAEPSGTSGRNVCLPNGTTDVTGNQLASAPKWTASLGGEYARPMGRGLNGFVDLNYYYRSSLNFTAAHDPRTQLDGYSLFGGSVGVRTEDGRVRGALFVRNLFDKRVPTFIVADVAAPLYGDVALGGDYWQQFGETSFRTIGVSLDVRF